MTLQPLPDADPERAFRFMAKVFEHGDHWLWTGQSTITENRQTIALVFQGESAPRYAYRTFHGELPEEGYLHRTCKQLFCLNPQHYRAGKLPRQPSRAYGDRDACSAGHEYIEGSYVMRKRKRKDGDPYFVRDCKQCHRDRSRKRYYENREACIAQSSEYQRNKEKSTSCSAGHEYVEGSYRVREKVSRRGRPYSIRICRHCEATRNRVRREKKKSAPQSKETRA